MLPDEVFMRQVAICWSLLAPLLEDMTAVWSAPSSE